ncbi:bifunctional hydroxymethylpyrimidine kinase/phosphomethylpyrimidine kinase [Prevotella dentasini]|uniref:bifunctional hydroxymethylpyrimidine kinase/phosphomethylpyrimidine kinase n=1 Tax=Prevotella dentasini TaxID=589537 RepID=UPI00046A033C|nr:bifunctional hydroxymethylpyrimidine kinase/phosphomethylpyrimidine kinase [Prevotella dentasini]
MYYVKTLTVAGSDSCGGAGIQADIKTMSALGCYAASVVTAVTAQNTTGVTAIQQMTPEMVRAQLRAVLDDLRPQAVKVGMLGDRATVQAVATELAGYSAVPLIADPVMVSTSGSRLMEPDAVEEFCKRLLPMATLLTPNIPEAEVLSGMSIQSEGDMDRAARRIMDRGCKALLIKGGHTDGAEKADRLYFADGRHKAFRGKTIETRNTHGTGCTLSSAIAAYMARGEKLPEAVRRAKEYVSNALAAGAGVETGGGHGPVNHFFLPEKLIIQ